MLVLSSYTTDLPKHHSDAKRWKSIYNRDNTPDGTLARERERERERARAREREREREGETETETERERERGRGRELLFNRLWPKAHEVEAPWRRTIPRPEVSCTWTCLARCFMLLCSRCKKHDDWNACISDHTSRCRVAHLRLLADSFGDVPAK